MPTYQFVCDSCGKDFEFFLMRMLRDEDKICPSCGSTDVKRVYRDFFGFSGSSCGSTGGGGYYSGGGCGSGGFS